MGFFTSRKTDNTTTTEAPNDKSVVQVFRSRFYGKKGKEREEPISYIPQSASVAQTLSIGPSSTNVHVPVPSSPFPAPTSRLPSSPSIAKLQNEVPVPPATPPKQLYTRQNMPPTPKTKNGNSPQPSSRKSIDLVTATLAQRLNELATANAEGLLNDDEYRLLRQNLFERFSTASDIPSETSIVPAIKTHPKHSEPSTPERPTSRPLSNFQVELQRPPSSNSRFSMTSGVASIFRRSIHPSTPKDSDVSSMLSTTSASSSKFKLSRFLSRKSSTSSIRTSASQNKVETMSLSSRRDVSGYSRSETPQTIRRRMATPPSSFRGGIKPLEIRPAHNNNIYDVFDEDHLSSAADIRQEIIAVETEVRRLMDAFNGLEVTTLSKTKRSRGYSVTRSDGGRLSNAGSGVESKWTADARSPTRRMNTDSDAGSVYSATSNGTAFSMAPKSVHSTRMGLRPKTSLHASLTLTGSPSHPGSLGRKDSSSSIQSHGGGKLNGTGLAPPSPSQTFASQAPNGSSLSLARSGHFMASVPEDDVRSGSNAIRLDEEMDEDNEVEDIRRRREEVQMRYEGRLDYLRAKLKSAELHEKLLRK